MEKCINCSKEYTSRGIKLHRRKCDKVYLLLKEKENAKIEKESKKIKISFSYNENMTLGNYLPDDCVKLIYQFVLLNDRNISYFKSFEYINNISLVCKNFYLNRPNIKYMKEQIKNEMNQTICRSWSSKIFGLNNEELEDLDYDIVSKRYGYTLHLFNIIDVKDLAYKKYGTEYDYIKFLSKKLYIMSLTKKEKDIIYQKRKDIYDKLFNKYYYKNNSFLEKIYNQYYNNYIKKEIPRINTIEDIIKKNIDKIEFKNHLIIELSKLNITYFETKEVLDHNNINKAIISIKNRLIKENDYKNYLYQNNYNNNEYDFFAYTFIDDSTKNLDVLIKIINETELIKKYIDNKISIKKMNDITDITYYFENVVEEWCNKNKKSKLEDFEFIKYFNYKLQEKIKNKFLVFRQEENKINNRIEIINNYKNGIHTEKTKNLYCLCNNACSINCIDFLCKICCKNKNCKKHYKLIN